MGYKTDHDFRGLIPAYWQEVAKDTALEIQCFDEINFTRTKHLIRSGTYAQTEVAQNTKSMRIPFGMSADGVFTINRPIKIKFGIHLDPGDYPSFSHVSITELKAIL